MQFFDAIKTPLIRASNEGLQSHVGPPRGKPSRFLFGDCGAFTLVSRVLLAAKEGER